MRKLFLLAIVALLMAITGCGVVDLVIPPTPTPTPTATLRPTFTPAATSTPLKTAIPKATPAADPQAEYYRGLYDVCVQATGDLQGCLGWVTKAYKSKWYEQPSAGWEWPLPGMAFPGQTG